LINQFNYQNNLDYTIYNQVKNTYFGMLSYIMLNLITNKPIRTVNPQPSEKPRKPSKRISARQVQNNLDAFIKEQRQVNKVLLEFVVEQRKFNEEQREFNKKIMARIDQVEANLNARIDNIVAKNNLVE